MRVGRWATKLGTFRVSARNKARNRALFRHPWMDRTHPIAAALHHPTSSSHPLPARCLAFAPLSLPFGLLPALFWLGLPHVRASPFHPTTHRSIKLLPKRTAEPQIIYDQLPYLAWHISVDHLSFASLANVFVIFGHKYHRTIFDKNSSTVAIGTVLVFDCHKLRSSWRCSSCHVH